MSQNTTAPIASLSRGSNDSKDLLESQGPAQGIQQPSVEDAPKLGKNKKVLLFTVPFALVLGAAIGYFATPSSTNSSGSGSGRVLSSIDESNEIVGLDVSADISVLSAPLLKSTPAFNLGIIPTDASFQVCTHSGCQFTGTEMFNILGPITGQSMVPFVNGLVPSQGSGSGLTSTLSYSIATSQKDVADSVSANAKISGSYLGFKGEAEATYGKIEVTNSTSVHALLFGNTWTDSYNLIDPKLKDSALNLAVSNPHLFIDSYGSHYITRLIKGCRITIDMNIKTSSSDIQVQMGAKLKAEYKGLFGVSAAAEIKKSAEAIDKSSTFGINIASNIGGGISFTTKVEDIEKIYNEFNTKCKENAAVQMVAVTSYLSIPEFRIACSVNPDCMTAFEELDVFNQLNLSKLTDSRSALSVSINNLQALSNKGYFLTTGSNNDFEFNRNQNQCKATKAQVQALIPKVPELLNNMDTLFDGYGDYMKANDITGYQKKTNDLTTAANLLVDCTITPTLMFDVQYDGVDAMSTCDRVCKFNYGVPMPYSWSGAECVKDPSKSTNSCWDRFDSTPSNKGTCTCRRTGLGWPAPYQ